jgi:hypothetical protein
MKGLFVSLIAMGALCAATPGAMASSHVGAQTVGKAPQSLEASSRHRHWRRAPHYRIVVGPRRYRYAYGPVLYPRPYYGYRAYNPYYAYTWGPGPFFGFGGYRSHYYRGPWSGYLMGLGYGW